MNKIKIIIYLVACLAMLPYVATAESFPAFPMSFYGEAKLNNNSLLAGTKIQAYGNNILVGEVVVQENGIYGYNNPVKSKLVIGEYSGEELIFKYMFPNTSEVLTSGIPVVYKDDFKTGETVKFDIHFMEQTLVPPPPPTHYCGNGACSGNETCSNCPSDCGSCPSNSSSSGYSPITTPVTTAIPANKVKAPATPAIPPTVEKPIVKGIESNYRTIQINKILNEAKYIFNGDASSAAQNRNKQRNENEENEIHNKYVARLIKGINGLMQSNITAFTNFILYGTETADILGAGERAGVINSYKSAFNKLPTTESEWQDAIKIANGRWPSEKSETTENNAKKEFKKVYKREANMENPNDNAAVTVIAYGLRPDVRNLDNEKVGIKTFKHIYGYNPSSAIDWDIARAIAYSGATR